MAASYAPPERAAALHGEGPRDQEGAHRRRLGSQAAGVKRIEANGLVVTAVFSPPDRRPRDRDGMLSSIKAYLDGIADVIGVDDSLWEIAVRKAPPRQGGNVRIEIEVAA